MPEVSLAFITTNCRPILIRGMQAGATEIANVDYEYIKEFTFGPADYARYMYVMEGWRWLYEKRCKKP